MKFYNIYCRAFQKTMKFGSYFLSWKDPQFFLGPGSVRKLAKHLHEKQLMRVLVVTDPGVARLGLMEDFLQALKQLGIHAAVFDQTRANPTIACAEAARALYLKENCQAIVGFGGGSPMDCAKLCGARIVKPNKPLAKMQGLFKILKKLPPLYCVPTTAGTGSEITIAAVALDDESHVKFACMDPSMRPKGAALDPNLTLSLPAHMTATTGMDALTHAVEAYIGHSNTKRTAEKALEATRLIFENLELACQDSNNVTARDNMLRASCAAGIAFTRAYVGNVHAIAHALGAFYNVPHGLANAVIMPYVLDFYGEKARARLNDLAKAAGLNTAEEFIAEMRAMNARMGLPETFDSIKEEDLPALAAHATKEANPLYPVPVIMTKEDVIALIKNKLMAK